MDALTIGLSPDRFWSLSLRELWNERTAHVSRVTQALDRDVRTAWHVEAFRRTERLPKLSDVLRRDKGRPQSRDEQLQALQMLSAMYRIPLRKRKTADASPDPKA